jgi:hypothetical protein
MDIAQLPFKPFENIYLDFCAEFMNNQRSPIAVNARYVDE